LRALKYGRVEQQLIVEVTVDEFEVVDFCVLDTEQPLQLIDPIEVA
jgi:hypothetical protein